MTYYKQFAEMLGLELGQEFNTISFEGEKLSPLLYKITKNGIFSKDAKDTCGFWGLEPSTTVDRLLSGVLKAVPKPWKLKVGEKYFYYSVSLNRATTRKWCNGNYDLLLWKYGNCFKTEKEANEKGKEIMEQIKKEYEEA